MMKLVITKEKIIDAIRNMRERDGLSAIIHAAEARDSHLSNLESNDRKKRAWAKFSHLHKGDTVFVHKKLEQKDSGFKHYSHLYGQPLVVVRKKPRRKEIIVAPLSSRKSISVLTALMALDFKLSEEPTSAAFDNVLAQEALARQTFSKFAPNVKEDA